MSKMTSFHIRLSFLISVIALISSGCRIATPTITPTLHLPTAMSLIIPTLQTPTIAPPFIHYTPTGESNIHLEFDYPSSWVFSEKLQDVDFMVISLWDPRLLTVPTQAPDQDHGTPSDVGEVSIWIEPAKPGQALDSLVEPYKQGHSNVSWIMPLNDYKSTLNGYDSIVLEYQINSAELYTSLMFERDIFFIVKNKMYQITFLVAEKERGGEFEKGYEYFIKSLKIVP
jgi:hypothetical protein